MAPLEDLHNRDLAWISDFVMQQFVIMIRPVLDRLDETDAAVDYVDRMVQQVSLDVSEVRDDVGRSQKYLALLRQGLGEQNEGKCMLQLGLEGTTRAVKRMDEQMENMLGVMQGVEESFGQLHGDMRGLGAKQEDLTSQVSMSAMALDDLRAKAERISNDVYAVKDDLRNSEARQEVWQNELRELRRISVVGLAPKLEAGRPPPSKESCRSPAVDSWPQKQTFASSVDVAGGSERGGNAMASGLGDANSSGQQSKRMSRKGSGSGRLQLQQDHLDFAVPSRSSSKPALWSGVDGSAADRGLDCAPADEAPGSRLPLLTTATRAPAALSRPPQPRSSQEEASRLRFSATMAEAPSRGNPC
mmetsp:Transcript_40741/g.86757  ORF Transcript_40741/g.86757 Transcript_40741/m.86757 type:complete len:359 (-) Transcript_40741:68-1144(-)